MEAAIIQGKRHVPQRRGVIYFFYVCNLLTVCLVQRLVFNDRENRSTQEENLLDQGPVSRKSRNFSDVFRVP